jgi:hypothetical protein
MNAAARIGLVIALGAAVGCGKSPEQERAEALQKAAVEMQKGAQDRAKGVESVARGMTAAFAGTTADGKPIEPVDFHVLQEALPEISGWQRGTPTGEKMTMPVRYSHASARYSKGPMKIEAKITDSALNRVLVTPMAMMLTAGYAKETDRGYEKSTKIAGNPGFEKWSTSKTGELNVLVKDRFIVEVEGRGLSKVKDLYAFLEHIDLKMLGEL